MRDERDEAVPDQGTLGWKGAGKSAVWRRALDCSGGGLANGNTPSYYGRNLARRDLVQLVGILAPLFNLFRNPNPDSNPMRQGNPT